MSGAGQTSTDIRTSFTKQAGALTNLARGAYDKRFRVSQVASPDQIRNTANHFAGSRIRGAFASNDLNQRNTEFGSHCDLLQYNSQSHTFQRPIRPATAKLIERQALHSRISSQQLSPKRAAQQSPNLFLSNNTLLKKMLSEKGAGQIKMPLASTFHKKSQLGMLSKD